MPASPRHVQAVDRREMCSKTHLQHVAHFLEHPGYHSCCTAERQAQAARPLVAPSRPVASGSDSETKDKVLELIGRKPGVFVGRRQLCLGGTCNERRQGGGGGAGERADQNAS